MSRGGGGAPASRPASRRVRRGSLNGRPPVMARVRVHGRSRGGRERPTPGAPIEATPRPRTEGHAVVGKAGYRLELSITPNLGGRIDSDFRLRLTRGRPPRERPRSLLRFTMPAMEMPELRLALP